MRTAAAAAASAALVGLSALSASAADFAGTATATDTDPRSVFDEATHPALPGGGQALWDGGTVVFPAEPDGSAGDGNQVYPSVGATLQAPRPVCEDGSFADDGTVTVTVTVRVSNDGPSQGRAYVGGLRLFDGDGAQAIDSITDSAPVGHAETLTVTAHLSAADLESGDLAVHLATEAFHAPNDASYNTGTQWTADQFEATHEFGAGECDDDEVPMVAPVVALGAGLLALGGYGIHRIRGRGEAA